MEPEPIFFTWSWSQKIKSGAGAEKKWLGSATLKPDLNPDPLNKMSQSARNAVQKQYENTLISLRVLLSC